MSLLFLAALLTACRDAPTDPLVGIVAEEAMGALALGVVLPDPAALVPPGQEGEGAQALESWRRSWDLPLDEARRLREKLYPELVEALAGQATPDALRKEVAVLGEGVLRARTLDASVLPGHIASRLTEATARYQTAQRALASGDPAALFEALIRGGDALREVGPEAVARDLMLQVETALGRVSPDDSYSDQDLERLRRLVQGGRQAVEAEDWALAIRRAYYAKALLDGGGRSPSW